MYRSWIWGLKNNYELPEHSFYRPRILWIRYRSWFKKPTKEEIQINFKKYNSYHIWAEYLAEDFTAYLKELKHKYYPFDETTTYFFISNNIYVETDEYEVVERYVERKEFYVKSNQYNFAESVKIKGKVLVKFPILPLKLWLYVRFNLVIEITYERIVNEPFADDELIHRVKLAIPSLLAKYVANLLAIRLKIIKYCFKKVGIEYIQLRIKGFDENKIEVPIGIYKCRKCGKHCWGILGCIIHYNKYHKKNGTNGGVE